MGTFKSLRPIAFAVAILCVVAGATIAGYSPTGAQGPSPADNSRAGDDMSAASPDSGKSQLLVCPIDRCPAKPADREKPGTVPDEVYGSFRCDAQSPCPPEEPPDRVTCMAIGCPTGDENDHPVSNEEPEPGQSRGAPARDLPADVPVSNFEECARAGYPVAESYPEQCISPYGSFTRPVG